MTFLHTYLNCFVDKPFKAQWSLRTTGLNIQQFHVLTAQCNYVFCVDLRSNRDYFPPHHKLIGFYSRGWVCLLRCTSWIFKYYRGNGCFGAQIIRRRCNSPCIQLFSVTWAVGQIACKTAQTHLTHMHRQFLLGCAD
jgi:hypothetical protein